MESQKSLTLIRLYNTVVDKLSMEEIVPFIRVTTLSRYVTKGRTSDLYRCLHVSNDMNKSTVWVSEIIYPDLTTVIDGNGLKIG